MKKILFTGGGSAGHVIPNIALMEEVLSTGEADVCYMGTNGIEKKLVADWKIPYYQITCPKLIREKSFSACKNNVKIPAAFLQAVKQATEGLNTFQPDVIFSKGGFVSLPVVFAAHKLKIPCYTHESDFSLGLANRLMTCKCEQVFTSFPETATHIRKGKYSGAPIRRSIFYATKADARQKMDIPFSSKVLLVFGGGSGSEKINTALRQNLKTLCEKYVILHVCGKGNLIDCNLKNYRQFEFIADMGTLYAACDAVISRSGAGAVFEILALKKPSILIPLEGATRGDQVENARYFSEKGLCYTLRQTQLDLLEKKIEEIFQDEQLKERLLSSSFQSGNAVILRALRSHLKV